MMTPRPDAPLARRAARSGVRVAVMLALALMLVAQSGCRTMWQRVRENERVFSLETARKQAGRGQCAKALSSLDRAEARMDIGVYGREAISTRIRCYEKLGHQELASAHRRLLQDYYTNEPMAFPEANGTSVFRVKKLQSKNFEPPPGWLGISRPRYTPHAQRSKIVGRVVISFELSRSGRPTRIRVLEMPHPLLATWAIEAIAQAEKKKKLKTDPVVVTGSFYVTTFVFEWRWAIEEPDEEET